MSYRAILLGTGTIIPSRERRATALVVEDAGALLLLDCGPGALEALEENGFSFRSLRTVCITHFHPDHTLGLGHLLAALNADPRGGFDGTLKLIGPRGLGSFMRKWNELYHSTVPSRDYLDIVEIDGGDAQAGLGLRVTAARARHGDTEALAYRIDCEGSSLVFTGDTEYADSIVDLARGADILVAECSFPDSRPVEGHCTPSSVGRMAASAGVKRVVLVHLYPIFADEGPLEGIKKVFTGAVEIGYDGMEIELGKFDAQRRIGF
jgi:ribonuclease BN (tRNA processing enzyme)